MQEAQARQEAARHTKPPVVPGTRGAPQEKLFHLTAEGTYEFTRERQRQSVYFGATTKLLDGDGQRRRHSHRRGGPAGAAVSFAGGLVGLEEDTVTRAETPRPDGTWLTCETAGQSDSRGPCRGGDWV